eukprot:Em0014g16a
MMTEYRLEVLQEYRGHILSGTLLTGMKVELRPSELNVEKQYKGQQSLKEHVSYSYKLWKTMTFTKEYQLIWSGQDNRSSKGDHLQDLIQRIPPIDLSAGTMITDICAAGLIT